MNTFENFGLSNELLESIRRLDITKPTQIQELSIPYIMQNKDLIGESATGSGKTLAFGCSITDHVSPGQGLQALILTPTRELAEQVKNSLKQFSSHKRLNIIAVYGGVSINPQIQDLRRVDVVVATPGRLLDHIKRRTINLAKIKILVLDEADRMFDMGFIDDVERIIKFCPVKRQTMFFSATISPQIKQLARRYMVHPEEISAVNQVDPSKLKQFYYNIDKNMKLSLLIYLLKKETSGLAMVFCNTRRTTDFIKKNLDINKVNSIIIHGGLSQNKRTNTINLFNNGKVGVLICTDIAARGLHIENVSHIYNYEIPRDPKDYVHRIGRTARAGEEGKAVNLLCDYDYDNFSKILNEYRAFTIQKMDVPELERIIPVRVDTRRRFDNSRRFNSARRYDNSKRFGDRGRFRSRGRFGGRRFHSMARE